MELRQRSPVHPKVHIELVLLRKPGSRAPNAEADGAFRMLGANGEVYIFRLSSPLFFMI